MSYGLPHRNVRFRGVWLGVDGRVMVSARGRARADAQSRSDGRGSAVIGTRPRRKPGFVFDGITVVNAPERRLWAIKREDRRALLARRSQ
jgi:hypothetical protein